MSEVKINYSNFDLKNGGKGVIAVLFYSGNGDPKIAFDKAVMEMSANTDIGYFELIDAHLNNPWMRVILTDINDMGQEDFDSLKHNLKKLKK